ncbi:hypothetical protein [Serratia marcescens]|uniref:hypothetical protein n=1 Tax=Serratia marcescens TaxID=615 RepID=UPI0016601E9A|nr:hypothetical protein [Serratia marcescens]
MDNKLSELSKPVGFVSKQAQVLLKSGDTASVRPFFDVQGSSPLYSQEYVSALLAELEAKDTPTDIRVAEIEKRLKQRAEEMERILEGITPEMIAGGWTAKGISDYAKSLEAKLATPVRLPRPACTYADHSYPAYSRNQVEEILSSAGMCFTVEGDDA